MSENIQLKKNDTITVKITDINNLGIGVGHYPENGGITVFVKGTVTGDEVEAKIIKTASSFVVGKLEKILHSSEMRADCFDREMCNSPQSCGGCCYRNIKYECELETKREYVVNAFKKAQLPFVEVLPVISTGQVSRYRNKAQYRVCSTSNGLKAGFFAQKTHTLIPCYECILTPAVFTEIVNFTLDFANLHGITAYDEASGKGLLRHIYIRMGVVTHEIMVCLVINGNKLAFGNEYAKAVSERFPDISSVMININKKKTNAILGDKFVCLYGRDYIEDELCGLRFRISAGSFYQVNHDAAEILYMTAKQKADLKGDEILVDLYCGIGTIGMSMADSISKLVGIEIVDEAVECAKLNAKLNGVKNAFFFCGDASDSEGLLTKAKQNLGDFTPDVVVMDPPRSGSSEQLLSYLSCLGIKKIIYVSCNPDTLARDCAFLYKNGYIIGKVTPVDMFPGTGHVESVVCLTRHNELPLA